MAGSSAGARKGWLKRVRSIKTLGIGTVVRRARKPGTKMKLVMSAFKRGWLTSHGRTITNRRQAIAIGLSYMRR